MIFTVSLSMSESLNRVKNRRCKEDSVEKQSGVYRNRQTVRGKQTGGCGVLGTGVMNQSH